MKKRIIKSLPYIEGKKAFVAKITGLDTKYFFKREFVEADGDKDELVEFPIDNDGLYEFNIYTKSHKAGFVRVFNGGKSWELLTKDEAKYLV